MNNLIKKSTDCLILKFLKPSKLDHEVTDPAMRKKYAYLEAWVSIVGNLTLSAIKIVFGLMLNSISLLADAAHTASDVATSVVVLLGFKFSSSPADKKHPYGHGRAEFIATLLISIMLILVGVEFGKTSYERFVSPSVVGGNFVVALIMLLGALIKEWMSRFSIELGKRTNASALLADAWHHRTDAIASAMVAIAMVASRYGYYKVDALFGLVVSALIIYTGVSIGIDSSSKLLGEVPEDSVIKDIEKTALSVCGVSSVHKVSVHNYGSHKEISLHIQVDNDLSLIKAHEISEEVERAIESQIPCKAMVHAEPMMDLHL